MSMLADDYTKQRSNIKSGDVIAWRGKGFWSFVSRVITKSPYGHLGIAWLAGGRVFVLECYQKKGVTISALSSKLEADHFPLNVKWCLAVESLALEEFEINKKRKGFFKRIFSKETVQPNKWTSAEFAVAVLNKAGITVTSNLPGFLTRELRNHIRPGSSITRLLKK